MCKNCDNEKSMKDEIEEIKKLLDEIVEEAHERLRSEKEEKEEKCDSAEEAWRKIEVKLMMKLDLSRVDDKKYDKSKVKEILDKTLAEAIKTAVLEALEESKYETESF